MKSEHRHELQKNELAEGLVRLTDWCKQNAALLMGVILGVAVVIGAFVYFRNQSTGHAAVVWNEFFSASARNDSMQMTTLSSRESGTIAGQLAGLVLADAALNQGVESMGTDRIAAEAQLNEAKAKYSQVRSEASDPLVLQRATLGLARYYETIGLLDEAIKEYRTLADQYKDGPFAELATSKIDYLDRPSTRAFAKWYSEHKPLPPSPMGTGGFQGFGDLNKLPPDESAFPGLGSGVSGSSAP
jgi:predicted negative regulator of RcsB-dependent stress response